MKTVWITSYCLTSGILKFTLDKNNNKIDDKIIKVNEFKYRYFTIGKDAFFSKLKAIQDAEQKRIKKLKYLRNQIEKLEKLKFEV